MSRKINPRVYQFVFLFFPLLFLAWSSISQPLSIRYSAVGPSCAGATDGFITVYGSGGLRPYTYSYNGGSYSSNNLFAGLGAISNISVSVRDAAGAIISEPNITLSTPANSLIIRPDSLFCTGSTLPLYASGGGTYSWTSTPNDPSISNPNAQYTTASPTQNTVYTVVSSVPRNRNLIDNGDFEKGDVAFESQYTSYPYPPNPANPSFAQRAYSIVFNGRQFEPQFQPCTDHTSGNGRMMAIDGATAPNVKIWSQKVSVLPNTTYTVQYWLQSIDPNSPAQLELQMNGAPITGNAVTSTSTASATSCLWQQANYSWNSGANTSVEIAIIGRNLSSFGNDFAIDDISMTHPVSCTFSKSTSITVIPGPFVNAGPDKTIISGDEVTLDGSGITDPTLISWSPNTNITGANTYTPRVSPPTTTRYFLSVRGNNNCVSTDNVLVTVLPYCIKVMDAFTPNGDGMNDRWLVVNNGGVCVRQISVGVYNRYGNLVYNNDNYNNDWTGLYRGKPLPDGTYYYVVAYQLLTGSYLKLKGDVTILR